MQLTPKTKEPSPCLPDVYSSMLIFILILDKMLKSIRGGCWNMKAPENVLQTGTAEIKPLEEQ